MILIQKQFMLATVAAFLFSCGSDDSSTDPVGEAISALGNASAINELAAAYPYALSASAFPTNVSSTSLALLTEDQEKTTQQKIEETDKILRADVDSCFKPAKFEDAERPDVLCYEFDNDMNPFNNGPAGSGGTTNGKHTDGEACLVAFSRQQIGESIEKLERGLALVSALICQVKKNEGDATLPTLGEEKEYTEDLKSVTGADVPVTSASMTRLEDKDGRAVYRTDISFRNPKGIATELSLVHSPGPTADEDEGGLFISSPLLPDGQQGGDMNNNEENMNHVLSIKYSGSIVDDEPRMRMRISRANLLNTIAPFDETGDINYADIPEGADNTTANNFNLTEFDINPSTNEGLFAYWRNPGGSYNEAARGLLFNVGKEENGTLRGCGVSGSVGAGPNGTSIRKSVTDPVAANELKPKMYWHPFHGGNTATGKDPRYTANEGAFITKQCFIQNAESGQYLIDETFLSNDEDLDQSEALARGYSVLPGEKLDINRPTPPRDQGTPPPPQN